MYEKAWCTSKVLVLPIQAIAFLTFSLRSPSWFLNCLLGLNETLQLYPVLSFGPIPPALSSRFSDFWPALFLLKATTILSLGILRTSPVLLTFPVLYTSTLQIEREHSNKSKNCPKWHNNHNNNNNNSKIITLNSFIDNKANYKILFTVNLT